MQYRWKGSQSNRLSLDERLHQSLNVTVFKYVNNVCPYYLREIFEPAMQGGRISRSNYSRLHHKSLSYIGPSVWINCLISWKETLVSKRSSIM